MLFDLLKLKLLEIHATMVDGILIWSPKESSPSRPILILPNQDVNDDMYVDGDRDHMQIENKNSYGESELWRWRPYGNGWYRRRFYGNGSDNNESGSERGDNDGSRSNSSGSGTSSSSSSNGGSSEDESEEEEEMNKRK